MTHFLGILDHRLLDTPEGRTFKHVVEDSISLKPGDTFQAFSGFTNLLTSHLGEIKDLNSTSPTLTHNSIGRHVSQMVKVKVINDNY